MKLILLYYDASVEALAQGADINDIVSLGVREKIGRFKYVPEKEIEDTFIQNEARLKHEIGQALTKEVV